MPRVTVVTPNYNHARYLPERIDSILAQTFQDFELLILDNASTDNSREVIESYTSYQNVRAAFNAENNGSPFKQWNLGLSQAKGEYVWFAESDDYADPACWRPSSIAWIGTPTPGLPCVSRGQSTRTVNCWETMDIC